MRYLSVDLSGRVRNFKLPRNKPLIPLFEAIVNSINAIEERAEKSNFEPSSGCIEIQIERKSATTLDETINSPINGFTIKDNGIGFTESNMDSFCRSDSSYKAIIGGKGVGRFTWLKAMNEIEVDSIFEEGGIWQRRHFLFSTSHAIHDDSLIEIEKEDDFQTSVSIRNFRLEYEKDVPKKISTLAMRVIQHCLVYFLDPNCPRIVLKDEKDSVDLNSLFHEKFKPEQNMVSFDFIGEKFDLLNVRIEERTFEYGNCLYLCANSRLVDSKHLENYMNNLDSQIFDKNGFWYVGVLTSSYFDKNVDVNRLSFDIPDSRNLLGDSISVDGIVYEACEQIKQYLSIFLSDIAEEKLARIKKYVQEVAPQYRHLIKHMPVEIDRIKPGLSDDKLDDELYKIKRNFERLNAEEGEKLLEQGRDGFPNTIEYQNAFRAHVSKVSEANQSMLAEYVVHRKSIMDLFEVGLQQIALGKYQTEAYLHNLIYPMRATSEDVNYNNHNLWLIDEKLSYCTFISSDTPFNNDPNEQRTDILVLDHAIAVSDEKNQGSIYGTIILFELKRPMRNDYTLEKNPITQLIEYANRIRNGKVNDSNGRPIRASNQTQFYLYAVCDDTTKLEKIITVTNLKQTPDKMGYFTYNEGLNAYIELLTYDKILLDAKRRNKVLFNYLGIE